MYDNMLSDLASIPRLFTQSTSPSGVPQFFDPSSIDPNVALSFLGLLTLFILSLVYLTYRYQRWKRYQEFLEEMKTLDLDPESEGTFAWMVKRYQLEEPVNILYSARTFDEMATSEMFRILASAGSMQSKQQFIDTVYTIRTKTYHPDWFMNKKAVD